MSTLTVKELSHPAGEVIKIAAGKTLDLKSQGNVTMPTGSVVQIVQSVYSTYGNTNSSSYVDSGLTGAITPSSTSSKVLVTVSISMGNTSAATNNNIQIVRGSSVVYTSSRVAFNGAGHSNMQLSFVYLDSPSTTSATTYKLQMKTDGGYFRINDTGAGGTGTSTITLMEIQG